MNIHRENCRKVFTGYSRNRRDLKYNKKKQERKSDITRGDIIYFLKNIMYADIRDFISRKEGKVTFKDSSEWTDEMAMQVESVRQTREGIELKLIGKAWTVQRLCRMLGLDEPQVIELSSRAISVEEAKDIVKELDL